jgi:hypothetical protein
MVNRLYKNRKENTMQWRLDAHSSGGTMRRLTCIFPNDESWYYGEIDYLHFQPHGIGAHYTKEGMYIQGGFWENGVLKHSETQEEYESQLKGE